jgi:hypothetical protein
MIEAILAPITVHKPNAISITTVDFANRRSCSDFAELIDSLGIELVSALIAGLTRQWFPFVIFNASRFPLSLGQNRVLE